MLQHDMHAPGSSAQNVDFLVEEPCRWQVEADASGEILRAAEVLQDDRALVSRSKLDVGFQA